MTAQSIGKVYLVGAGPGDPELITLKGKRCLEAAHVVLYDELANCELLRFAPGDAELVYVGKKAGADCADQREIEALLISHARRGKNVVRLKGGDPFLFGRGGEEMVALRAAGILCEVVPGVSAALAGPASAGIPITYRGLSSSLAIVTGHRAPGNSGAIKWGELARSVDTLVILMGLGNLREIMSCLLNGGCLRNHPAALIQSGTLPMQKTVIGTVATIADLAEQAGITSPTVIVVGRVARLQCDDSCPSEVRRQPESEVAMRAIGQLLTSMARADDYDA
jgi:uroporphyrin-III C-methyltransferase